MKRFTINLTSNLDFSLTRKRFNMMGKPSSTLFSTSKKLICGIFISALTLVFCTQISKEVIPFVPASDPALYFEIDSTRFPLDQRTKQQERESVLGFNTPPLVYDKEGGTLYTGEHNSYHLDERSELIHIKNTFRKGVGIKYQRFDARGNEISKTELVFENGVLHSSNSFESGVLSSSSIEPAFSESGYKEFNQFFPTGELKFKMLWNEFGYQGLMTLYDEKGTILEQELYQNGVLVEKIK